MADALTAVDSILVGVKPELDSAQNIVALNVSVALAYEAVDGARIGRTVQIEAWGLLTTAQQTALQEVQQTINQYIVDTYFT
tara:strand:- start:250 stop:495 length:246 start_codon:yes stop_codon:yes gene_type:complete